jgi:hypothetical protein
MSISFDGAPMALRHPKSERNDFAEISKTESLLEIEQLNISKNKCMKLICC